MPAKGENIVRVGVAIFTADNVCSLVRSEFLVAVIGSAVNSQAISIRESVGLHDRGKRSRKEDHGCSSIKDCSGSFKVHRLVASSD